MKLMTSRSFRPTECQNVIRSCAVRSFRKAIFETLESRQLLTGNGLQAQYFDNADLTNLKLTRIDPHVDFNWGTGTPDAAIANTTYSVRWTGSILPLYSEMHTFAVNADDGARLWVDNQLIINHWTSQAASEVSGQVALRAGQNYTLKMEYFQNGGSAGAQLSWSSPSQTKQVIPSVQLYLTGTADNRGSTLHETWTGIGGERCQISPAAPATPTRRLFAR